MGASWFICGAGTVLDATSARETLPIDRAIDDGHRADIRTAFN
jgi:hypothetical protein